MASGCILGSCKFCNELVWEDEDYNYDIDMNIFHKSCKYKFSYVKFLEQENEILKKEVTRLRLQGGQ